MSDAKPANDIEWPVEPGSRAFVDVRFTSGVTIRNYVQGPDPARVESAFNQLAGQGYTMIELPAADGEAPWLLRHSVAALRFRDASHGIVAPTANLLIP